MLNNEPNCLIFLLLFKDPFVLFLGYEQSKGRSIFINS